MKIDTIYDECINAIKDVGYNDSIIFNYQGVIRRFFRYLNRDDLFYAIAGIHAPRIKKIIPTLSDDEIRKIEAAIKDGFVTKRDAAIVITGLSCGMRACDLIRLRMSDIDWDNEMITFKKSKTGNQVCLPLTVAVGNVLAGYILKSALTLMKISSF